MKVLVSLVGAGPGDCDLWTLRAVERLGRADLVLHDSTVDVGDLRRFTKAECHQVDGPVPDVMIHAARAGKRVVRLYECDAFVVSAGSEDALALQAAGIPFEVVPGISAAIATPELAGIPVTHRGAASGFLVLMDPSTSTLQQALQGAQPKTVSLVMAIDMRESRALTLALVERGWNGTTPTAVIWRGSTADRQVWTGSLAQAGTLDVPAGVRGVVVVGEVVHLRDVLERSFTYPQDIEVQYGRR